ncbi:unnamed protein product, partial [Rotaria sp. Silwood2]
ELEDENENPRPLPKSGINPVESPIILCSVVLCYIICRGNALQCKTCEENNPSCLFEHDIKIRHCENEEDVCYSWLYRSGSEIGIRRDCLSISSPEYNLIKGILGTKDNNCLKRIRGLDCFTICSTDLCN